MSGLASRGVVRTAASARIGRGPVDRRHLASHGPDVRGELAAVVDRVEKYEPQELAHRDLVDHLAAHGELAPRLPAGLVEPGDLLVQTLPVLLEGPDHLVVAR